MAITRLADLGINYAALNGAVDSEIGKASNSHVGVSPMY